MMKEESTANTNWARICDTCRSAPCTVYCRADCAFLCTGCDARIHATATRHERVWICEACERSPAAFLCKADAASLCATCDSDIHSANPLARRHHRVPILPIPGTLNGPSMGHDHHAEDELLNLEVSINDDEDEAASWLLINPIMKNNNNNNQNNANNNNHNNGMNIMFNGESVDEYLDLDEYNSDQQNHQFGEHYNNQSGEEKKLQQYHNFQRGLDFEASSTEYGYPASFGHSVSVSSLDVGVVPESAMSEVSIPHPVRPPKGTIDLFSGPPIQMPTQLTPSDREARVLRYREKKKARKFEKTIRYASRKAYAETRPRIKGRFAKRSDVEVEVDQMFSSTLLTSKNEYGIVPSF